jgi:uncharacterized protein (TIGR02145 family)
MINVSSNQLNNGVIEKYCYNNDLANCDTYGGLYRWNEMMQYTIHQCPQGICPIGWHIPNEAEWCTLTQYIDPTVDCNIYGRINGTDIGGKMKEAGYEHWSSPNTGATNSSGFTVLPGGFGFNNQFFNIAGEGGYWSSKTWDSWPVDERAWFKSFSFFDAVLWPQDEAISLASKSVRCIKNENNNPPPSTPYHPIPRDGLFIGSMSEKLYWSCDYAPLGYDIYYGTTYPPPYITTISDTSWLPNQLIIGATYFWQIIPHGIMEAKSKIWHFTSPAPVFACGSNLVDSRDGHV